jgi:surfeit locus 1 family protein
VRIGPYLFRPKLVPTLAAVGMMALTAVLGRWQLNRAHEKETLQRLYETRMSEQPLQLTGPVDDAERLRYRSVSVAGEFISAQQIFIDNRDHNGSAGYHVMTPLKIAHTRDYVLVNRGWVARGTAYPAPPAVTVPAGPVEVSGVAVVPSKRFLELSSATIQGQVWQNLKLDQLRERSGLALLPVVVLQRNDTGDGLARIVEHPDTGIAIHQGYAFQWFALCAALFVTYVVVNTKRAT